MSTLVRSQPLGVFLDKENIPSLNYPSELSTAIYLVAMLCYCGGNHQLCVTVHMRCALTVHCHLCSTQEPLESEFNASEGVRPTNFSNPMYESFTDPDTTSPPLPGDVTPPASPPEVAEEVSPPPESQLGTSAKKTAGFSPSSIDTDIDTQGLVMEDDDDE